MSVCSISSNSLFAILQLGTQNHYADGIPQLYLATELLKPAMTNQDVLSSRVKLGTFVGMGHDTYY